MNSTVVVINWNSGDLLQGCIESLLATTTDTKIVVIDNASRDASLEFLSDFYDRVQLIGNGINRGFAAAVNQAFENTSTPYVLILNPDVRALPGAVQLLEEFMDSHPQAGAAGGYVGYKYLPRPLPTVGALVRENLGLGRPLTVARVLLPRGEGGPLIEGAPGEPRKSRQILKPSPYPLPEGEGDSSKSEPIQVDQPAAAALMIRRDGYEGAGRFDEQFFPAWYEDVDFCLRMKWHGWKIFFVPAAKFIHTGGYSAEGLGREAFLRAYYRNQLRFAQKHFGLSGTIAVRASIAAGVIGRMIGRPGQAIAYAKVLIGALIGW